MKHMIKALPIALGLACLATSAQATTIDFTGLLGTTDPVVGSVSFWAGDPMLIHDTYVDNTVTPGNEYLMSGIADGTGGSPASGYDTFIGVSKTGVAFGAVTFDIASDYNFPNPGDNTTLLVEAYLGTTLVGSSSVGVSDSSYQSLSLTIAGGFDKLFIYDNLNSFFLGETFHIDNFVYSDYQQPTCQGTACNSVPEPSALLLLGAGLAGLAFSKRRTTV